MKITQENGLQFVGKTLRGRGLHFFPMRVVLTKNNEIAVIDKNGVLMIVPSENDPPLNQIYFDDCI
jgi:hypothetical protein